MKFVVSDINQVPEALREHYAEQNGQYVLQLEGDIPALMEAKKKVAEFRDNNVDLNNKVVELASQLKGFEGIDPEEYRMLKVRVGEFERRGAKDPSDIDQRIAAAVEPLQKQIADFQRREKESKDEIKRRDLQAKLRDVASKTRIRETALEDFLARGLRSFDLDGRAIDAAGNQIYSEDKPAEVLGMEEWAKGLVKSAPHLFEESRGGGTPPGGGGSGSSAPQQISGLDPMEFGRNLEAIAKGKVIVSR